MYAAIGELVAIDLEDDNVFVYDDENGEPTKADYVAYYGFEKYMYVDGVVDCTNTEKEVDTYDHYIGAELQLSYKIGMERMARVRKRLSNTDGNTEGTGNYRAWVYNNEYEIEFCDVSTSKITTNIFSEKCCLRSTHREGNLSYLRKYVIIGQINVQYQIGSDSLYLRMATRP